VVVTISRGRVVWENGRLDVRPGTSRYVHLPTFGPLFDGIDRRDASRGKFAYGETPVDRQSFEAAAAKQKQKQQQEQPEEVVVAAGGGGEGGAGEGASREEL
jgi:hypothetical protein